MRAIFHVGHAKTGSTALQATMLASRRTLLERGILYPLNPNGAYNNHRLVFADLFEPNQVPRHISKDYAPAELPAARDEILASIRAEVAEHRPECLLMSSETRFGAWTAAQRAGFVRAMEAIGARDAEIVAYIRRPSGWYLSGLQQVLRASHVVKPPRLRLLAKPVEQFVQDFGRGRVHVRPFDRRALIDGDIVADFTAAFLAGHGLGASELTRDDDVNRSLSAESFDLSQRWRAVFHPDEPDRFLPSSRGLNAALNAIEAEVGPPRPRMHDELAERIDYCRDDLLRLRDGHGLVLPGYDYERIERRRFTTLPQEDMPLERIVRIDRAVQAVIVARLMETRWANEDAERRRWLDALPGQIERAGAPAARPIAPAPPAPALGALWSPAPLDAGDAVAALGGPLAARIGPALRRAGMPGSGGDVGTGPLATATLLERWLSWAAEGRTPEHLLREEGGRVLDLLRGGVEPKGFATAADALASRRAAVEALARSVRGGRALLIEVGAARARLGPGGAEMPGAEGGRVVRQGVGEVLDALRGAVAAARRLEPDLRVMLCAVPRGPQDGPLAAIEARAVLRAAMGEVAATVPGVEYLPALEVLAGGDPFDPAASEASDADLDRLAEAVAAALAARPAEAIPARAHGA